MCNDFEELRGAAPKGQKLPKTLFKKKTSTSQNLHAAAAGSCMPRDFLSRIRSMALVADKPLLLSRRMAQNKKLKNRVCER